MLAYIHEFRHLLLGLGVVYLAVLFVWSLLLGGDKSSDYAFAVAASGFIGAVILAVFLFVVEKLGLDFLESDFMLKWELIAIGAVGYVLGFRLRDILRQR
jgi:hypothetical protein